MGDGAGGWRLSGGTETGEPPPVCAPCVLYSWFSTCHTPALCTVTAFEWTQRFIWHDNDSRQGACCFWWHERPQDVFYYDLLLRYFFALMLGQVNQPDLISSWRRYLSLSPSFFLWFCISKKIFNPSLRAKEPHVLHGPFWLAGGLLHVK